MSYIKPQKIVKVVKLKRKNVYSRADSRYYSLDIFPNEIFKPGALKKKISTHYYMDGWDPEQNLIEFENIPVSGFALTKIEGGGNKMDLKIKDPRGFNVNITSANLTEISLNSTLSHGVICTKCVWLFDEKSSSPYLALEGTEKYQQAMERARQLTTTIDKEDLGSLKTGDCVMLRNGKSAYIIVANDFNLLQRQFNFTSATDDKYPFFESSKKRYLYALDKKDTDEFLKNCHQSNYTDPHWHYNHYLNHYVVPELIRTTQSQIVEIQSSGIRDNPYLNRIINLSVVEHSYVGSLTSSEKSKTLRLVGENLQISLIPVIQHLEEIYEIYQKSSTPKFNGYYHNSYLERYLGSLSIVLDQKIYIPRIATRLFQNNTDINSINKICPDTSQPVLNYTYSARSQMLNFDIVNNNIMLMDPQASDPAIDLFNNETTRWEYGRMSRSSYHNGAFNTSKFQDLKFVQVSHEINGETFKFYL